MKNMHILSIILFCSSIMHATTQKPAHEASDTDAENISFQIHNPTKQYSKIKTQLIMLGEHKLLPQIAKTIQFDLEFSDQLEVDAKKSSTELEPKVLSKLFTQGTSLCLYLKEKTSAKKPLIHAQSLWVEATLKDTSSGDIFFDKTFICHPHSIVYDSHKISDELMPILTGEKGPMLSSLAYCKQLSNKHKVVCVADYACKMERTLVTAKTINVAPCWHSKAPVLFYSQFTRMNSRLMSLDLHSKRHNVVCSYDGLNMQPSFSPDGSKAALCLSGNGNSEIYLYDQAICNKLNKRVFQQITHNKGNNASPCLLPNGNLVFCSDFQSGSPQIYILKKQNKTTSRLTNGRGYCASPAYCPKTNMIAYTRYVNKIFQIFTLQLDTAQPRERQLTFSKGDKLEPTWSECGKYIAFTYSTAQSKNHKLTHQIAVLNTNSGSIKTLTSSKEPKSFPSWVGQPFYHI